MHQTDGQQLGVDIEQRLTELGLGCEVVLLQEMQALCLGEKLYGAARDVHDFAMVDIEDGLGLGVVHNGQFVAAAQHLDRLKQMQAQIYQILAKRSGKPLAKIIRDTKRTDFYLDAQRAVDYGLIDAVVEG